MSKEIKNCLRTKTRIEEHLRTSRNIWNSKNYVRKIHRIPLDIQKYVVLSQNMSEITEYSRISKTIQDYSGLSRNIQKLVGIQRSIWEHPRISKDYPGMVCKIYKHIVQIQNMLEYVGFRKKNEGISRHFKNSLGISRNI